MRGYFENTGKLVRLILRRERIMSTLWVILLVLFSVALAPMLGNMFDAQARAAYVQTTNNPGMISMMGPVYGADNYTAGAMYSNAMMLWTILAVAVMNVLLVVRHTRGDEEKGRVEVVRSLPTGRLANVNATMIVALIINGAVALLTGLGIPLFGIEAMGFGASMLYGVVLGVSGLFFAALTALFAQISSSSRGATGLSLLALGVAYLVRGAGDSMDIEAVSRISPMGLIQRTQTFIGNYWWPVFAVLAETLVVIVVAYWLNSIRDMDQGFVHARSGRRVASPLLQSSFGLSFRLLRNTLIAWILGIVALGASYASVLGDIENFVNNSSFYAQVVGQNPDFTTAQMFVAMVITMIAFFALGAPLIAILKARGEEKDERAEHVLSRAVSRTEYLLGYTVLALVTTVLVQGATAVGLYSMASVVLENPGDLTLGYLLKANMVFLPAMWIMIGITVLLIGLFPKATSAIWGYFGFSFFASFIGRIPGILPKWVVKLTPFGYIPSLPVDSINFATLGILSIIALVLIVAGFVFYQRRDLAV